MTGSATVLLVRHGSTTETGARLTGRRPGIGLDERGRGQATRLAQRLAPLQLNAVVSSPLQRCRETAEAIRAAQPAESGVENVRTDPELIECDYGDWTGKLLVDLVDEPAWHTVQHHASAARFPGGEGLAEVAHRATRAVRDHIERLLDTHQHPVLLVCSHGDVIKAVLADALGMHLDLFQRIQADPCSLSAIRYTSGRPFVLRLNDCGETLVGLVPRGEYPRIDDTDAVVGGGGGGEAENPRV
ncbi:MSMEG_4193 family putative phosphomutase [Lipingzhangella sp. LS1_29]|uniref:MSMEG_4193 family putative phosphomutase n=1 Tax=Lipingzhangella rawalii TaxID=2055835 RepID=A0ABU2H1P1_9ACTN|nr:MSMEG_4193 family putative phosphomutase [Lipingzhangella rawalii]MDS1268922.1 MSMEG_4193 family putative phosphomutase [Lipingzhangella rawalii]